MQQKLFDWNNNIYDKDDIHHKDDKYELCHTEIKCNKCYFVIHVTVKHEYLNNSLKDFNPYNNTYMYTYSDIYCPNCGSLYRIIGRLYRIIGRLVSVY